MNNLLLEKLDELFLELDNSSEIREMLELKDKIYKDNSLAVQLKQYRDLDTYDPEIKEIKKEIIDNPLIRRYRDLENELYFTVLEMNKRFNCLFEKKECGK